MFSGTDEYQGLHRPAKGQNTGGYDDEGDIHKMPEAFEKLKRSDSS